jgi:hypothetical protein
VDRRGPEHYGSRHRGRSAVRVGRSGLSDRDRRHRPRRVRGVAAFRVRRLRGRRPRPVSADGRRHAARAAVGGHSSRASPDRRGFPRGGCDPAPGSDANLGRRGHRGAARRGPRATVRSRPRAAGPGRGHGPLGSGLPPLEGRGGAAAVDVADRVRSVRRRGDAAKPLLADPRSRRAGRRSSGRPDRASPRRRGSPGRRARRLGESLGTRRRVGRGLAELGSVTATAGGLPPARRRGGRAGAVAEAGPGFLRPR